MTDHASRGGANPLQTKWINLDLGTDHKNVGIVSDVSKPKLIANINRHVWSGLLDTHNFIYDNDNDMIILCHRFAPENFTEKQATAFIPFGIGNRMCIGNRLALLEMKATLIFVVKNFTISKTMDTPVSTIMICRGGHLTMNI